MQVNKTVVLSRLRSGEYVLRDKKNPLKTMYCGVIFKLFVRRRVESMWISYSAPRAVHYTASKMELGREIYITT